MVNFFLSHQILQYYQTQQIHKLAEIYLKILGINCIVLVVNNEFLQEMNSMHSICNLFSNKKISKNMLIFIYRELPYYFQKCGHVA